MCQPKGWGLLQSWLQRRQKGSPCLGMLLWPGEIKKPIIMGGSQLGPPAGGSLSLVSHSTACYSLILAKLCRWALQHQCHTGEDEASVGDGGRAGTSRLTCTGLAKRHRREALTLPVPCQHSHFPPQPGSAGPKQGSKLRGSSMENKGERGVHVWVPLSPGSAEVGPSGGNLY